MRLKFLVRKDVLVLDINVLVLVPYSFFLTLVPCVCYDDGPSRHRVMIPYLYVPSLASFFCMFPARVSLCLDAGRAEVSLLRARSWLLLS